MNGKIMENMSPNLDKVNKINETFRNKNTNFQ